ncbi:MAG: hypothetical protein OQL06_03315 [Gammaproteobacteria bacterium]|nr:hypothetical protein [Gammaproteobacteria bacterium]
MKIVRHLLSFTWLFVTLAFILGLIYFRADLFPESINKPVDTAMAAIEEATGINIPQYRASSRKLFISDSSEHLAPSDAKNPENIYSDKVYPEYAEDVTAPESVEPEVTYQAPIPDEEAATEKSEDMAAVVEIVKETISEKVDEMIETVEQATEHSDEPVAIMTQTEPAPATPEPLSTESVADIPAAVKQESEIPVKEVVVDAKQLLHNARSLYWKGDLKAAVTAYMDLAEQESLDPNVFGELGNIYYAQGKWKQAGDAYYEAAVLLLDLKQMAQVNYLLRVIQGLDTETAEKLKKKISG